MTTDNIILEGNIQLRLEDADGNVIDTIELQNLVVNGGKSNTMRLLGGDAAGYVITKIGVGTSSTAASVTDTALTGAFVKLLNTGGTTNIYTATSVKFGFRINTDEAVGMNIRELGLINSNGDLVARKVLDAAISKTSSFAIAGTWTLNIS